MSEPGVLVGGRYRLDERLHDAWLGRVWRAEDLELHKEVVIRCAASLPDDDDEWYGHRLSASHRAAARVRHPRVVSVLDAGDDPATGTYVVTEPVAAEPLRRLVPIGPSRTMQVVAEIAEALQAMHDGGIVHRYVDAANVLVRPDSSVVGLTGRVPFDDGTFLDNAIRVVRMAPPALPSEVPAPVRAVVERAMAKDPADRWPTTSELAAAARHVA